jgi:D-arabinose 1-dehydrogenase
VHIAKSPNHSLCTIGYPLPVLLRLVRLVAAKGNPVDIILSYSHSNLQNHSFEAFAPFFLQAGVRQLLTASPFNMGYLTDHTPDWHPASPEMMAFKDNQLIKMCQSWPGGLPNLALGYALGRNSGVMADIPTVAGFSRISEVHEAVSVWREVANSTSNIRKDQENAVIQALQESGWENYSWRSPPQL